MRSIVCVALLLVAAPALAFERPKLGDTRWVGQAWFQYLGADDDGQDLWLYPHTDGVPEVFTASADGPWEGSFDSRFDPKTGFTERFNAVEVLNELVAEETPSARKRRGARLLALFAALHPAPDVPYYLRQHGRAVRRHLGRHGGDWADASARQLKAVLNRVAHDTGTRIHHLPEELQTSDDHYRALVADGYLDVAVVGGNSLDEGTNKFH